MTTVFTQLPSPVGPLLLVGEDGPDGFVLTGLFLPDHRRGVTVEAGWLEDPHAFDEVARQLDAYFAGDRRTFDLPLGIRGGSDFQHEVWAALRDIPAGTTVTYGDLAARLGRPGSARAVGGAVARNPISIVVPCHRVVGSGGSLTGYAGGLAAKRRLLALEAAAGR